MKSKKNIYLSIISLYLFALSSNAQEKVVRGSFVSFPSNAQKTVHGKIVAFYKFPIEHAEISVNEEPFTTTSDSLGNFSIECKIKDKLSIKAKGFKPVWVKVKKHTDSINVSLIFAGMEKEITYSTGFREIRGDHSSYNIRHIDTESPNNSHYTSLINLIKARAPGIKYMNGNFFVRAINTITSSNGALIFVDGMPMSTQGLEDIPVFNVKSINILKGTATAIYGSRGLHGVIVVNLKK